ncbi:MAG TPA: carbohydrate ABC transporter permease, partial [Shinella sp.]|nr:carbohydrate ABC transporter permease [Shinella sp.]
FPIFWMVTSSFKSEVDISAYPPVWSFAPTLANYAQLFTELNAWQALLNSALIVGLSTCLAMAAGTMAAYALARFDVKGKEFLAFEILSIRMLPPIVSVIPMFIIARQLGIFDTPWLLIAAYALSGLPFVVWVMRVFIQDIPQSIEEAAMIDGCSRFETFWRVTLPLLLPGLAATMVIVFMFAWNEFLLASMLTSQEAKTLPVIAANAIKPKAIAWGLASAAGVMMSLPVVVLVLLMQRYLVRGLTLGAVKG